MKVMDRVDSCQRIKDLIVQTNQAYSLFSQSNGANTDYAEFASLAVHEFRALLNQPEMTRDKLCEMLRRGSYQHKSTAPASCWASYLARYMSQTSNTNTFTKEKA